jgi:dihydrofolate reductase
MRAGAGAGILAPMQRSVFIATSLDGYIARSDGRIDWLAIVERPGEDHGYAAFAATCDAVVIGRRTYDTVLGFDAWPYAGKRVIVMTHRSIAANHGEEAFDGSAEALVDRLAREGMRRLYVDGGVVIRQFLAAGLVDDLTISILPIVLGGGVPLFGGTEHRLTLDGVEPFASGLVQLRYRCAQHAP